MPLYRQISQLIDAQIQTGALREGDQLPSEPSLAKTFGVSRATAIAALDELVSANRAYRVKGRGTYVAKAMINRFSLATGFHDDMTARGFHPTSSILEFDRGAASSQLADKLGADASAEYFRILRLRSADSVPVALQRAFLPVGLFTPLTRDMLGESLYALMRERFALSPAWAESVVEARLATKDEASLLQIGHSDPVLIVWQISLDESLRHLEYVESVYRSDKFSFAGGRQQIVTT